MTGRIAKIRPVDALIFFISRQSLSSSGLAASSAGIVTTNL
jgi:hypothetical protein